MHLGQSDVVVHQDIHDIVFSAPGHAADDVIEEVPGADWTNLVGLGENAANHDSAQPDGGRTASNKTVRRLNNLGTDSPHPDDSGGHVNAHYDFQQPFGKMQITSPAVDQDLWNHRTWQGPSTPSMCGNQGCSSTRRAGADAGPLGGHLIP